MGKGLRNLLFAATVPFMLNTCCPKLPEPDFIKGTYINYRAKVTSGKIDNFTVRCGSVDQDGKFIDGQYFTIPLHDNQRVDTYIFTERGDTVKLRVDGKSSAPGTINLKIDDDWKTVVEKDITTTCDRCCPSYSINGEIGYYIPKK